MSDNLPETHIDHVGHLKQAARNGGAVGLASFAVGTAVSVPRHGFREALRRGTFVGVIAGFVTAILTYLSNWFYDRRKKKQFLSASNQ